MLKLHKIKALPILLIIALLAGSVYVGSVKAATVVDMVTTSSDQTSGNTTTLTSTWTTLSDLDAGDVITLTYGASSSEFDLTGLDDTNISVDDGAAVTVQSGACGATDSVQAVVSPQDVVLTFCDSYPTLSAGATLTITFDTVLNGDSTGSPHAVSFVSTGSTTYSDDGTSNVPVIDAQTVTVTATVDPTISFTLSTPDCDLGSLSTSAAGTCTYNLTGATNASGGMVVSADADGVLSTGAAGAGDTIADIGSPTAEATFEAAVGVEAYAFEVATLGSGFTMDAAYTEDTYDAVPTTIDAIFNSGGGPVASAATTIKHAANIDGTTPAGSYSQVVTWTAVGTF